MEGWTLCQGNDPLVVALRSGSWRQPRAPFWCIVRGSIRPIIRDWSAARTRTRGFQERRIQNRGPFVRNNPSYGERNFAGQPVRTPVKMYLAAHLMNQGSDNATAKTIACRHLGRRATSYTGFWVTRRSGGGVVCRHIDDLDAVLESDTGDDFRQLICAFQPPPGL